MADKKMEAQISVEFEEATSRQSLNSGERINILWSKVKRWLSDLKAVAFSGSYSDLSDTPTTATTTHDGLMSATDKAKLDGADNNYALKSKYGDTTINVGRKADTTVGEYSTAEGSGTTASGNFSHTEGSGTTASGNGSHSEGGNSIASGSFSHAEGADTTASNYSSHAGGSVSEASGRYSFSHGNRTQALHESEVAFGQNNISNDDTLFSIGDGAYNARHNAFEITTTGGKLHDKDIATTDMSLKANGGNADTVDGLHASDLVRAFNGPEMDGNRIQIPNDVHVGEWLRTNAKVGMCYYINPDNKGLTGLPDGNVGWEWFVYNGVEYFAKTIEDRLFYMNYINSYSGWSEIYTSKSKPYVTGTLSEQTSGTNVTMSFTIFNFTPSKVLCQFGSGNAFFANVVTNGFSVTIPAGTTTIHYIAFK